MHERVRLALLTVTSLLSPLVGEERAQVLSALRRICEECWKPTDAGACPLCGATVCQLCAEGEGRCCCDAAVGVDVLFATLRAGRKPT